MYEKFAELLAKNNMTTYEVSKRTGIPQSTFSMWKKRNTTLNAVYLLKIADLFGVEVRDLL